MSTNKSAQLNLHLWEPEDDFLRTEFNENFEKIDAGVKAEENARVSAIRAEQEARSSAIQEVKDSISAAGGTASSAVSQLRTELKQEIGAAQAAANAAQATAANAYCPEKKPYVTGSYEGTGTYGWSRPVSLDLGFRPSALMVSSSNGSTLFAVYPQNGFLKLGISWTANGVSWATDESADVQLNTPAQKYYYIAFR